MKFFLKLILAALVISAVFYFIKPPETVPTSTSPLTASERAIEQAEDALTREARIKRLFTFKDSVEDALHKRIPADSFVPADKLSEDFKRAVVATEDRRFYEHGGVDLYGIARALYVNTVAGETQEGASTITQQTVKNLFLSSKRIWSRKFEEVLLAVLMELYYTKEEILALYINGIYYGNDYHGIKEASEGYFGVSPHALTLAQSALLAGLPQAPTYYNPKEHFDAAKSRQKVVLNLLVQQGLISERAARDAYAEDLKIER